MVEVRYYGLFAQIAGCSKEKIEINETIPLVVLLERLKTKHKELAAYPMLISFNNRICEPEAIFRSGSSVDCMPPFSGG